MTEIQHHCLGEKLPAMWRLHPLAVQALMMTPPTILSAPKFTNQQNV